jgi:leucine-rich repeat transmembrane neuronal protein 1/2
LLVFFWQAYNQIDVYFQFKTLETEGLILYNAGKEDDFLAIELVTGHIQYTFNMG